MYEDEILRELWQVKDKLAAEYERDPEAFWVKLRQAEREWKTQGGRIGVPTRKVAKGVKKLQWKKG